MIFHFSFFIFRYKKDFPTEALFFLYCYDLN